MTLSFQLYSARFVPSMTDFLRVLADLGYAAVEGFPGIYDEAQDFRDAMDAAGLTMPTAHFPFEWVRDRPDLVKRLAETLGVEAVFVPAVADRTRDAEGWRTLGEELAEAGETFWAEGLSFGWHNHAFEFIRLASGEVPYDLILASDPRLAIEMDIAWMHVGGQDPTAWIAKYADRVAAVHVKDIAPSGLNADEDGWADVGQGILPWIGLKAQLAREAPTALMVIEHDRPADAARFASRSIAWFRQT